MPFHMYLFSLPSIFLGLYSLLDSTIFLIYCFVSINIITRQYYCFILLKIIFVFLFYILYILFFIFSFHFLIISISFLISLLLIFFQKSPSIQFSFGFKAFKASTCSINWSSIDFICFSNVLTSRKYLNWYWFYYSSLIRW